MESESTRADVALVQRGLAASREKAQALIASGRAYLNGRTLTKPSAKVTDADELTADGEAQPFVSRGGKKLEKALSSFGADVKNLVCLDVGASTGGFTDVLLKSGAKKVYAVDVGHGQLDPSIAEDPRVVSMEGTNARTLRAEQFPDRPALAVMDVSFISVRLILPALFDILGADGRVISLIKPQFEAGRALVGKHGLVTSPMVHREVLQTIVAFAPTVQWRVRALDYSPIAGGDGNIEFLADFLPAGRCAESPSDEDIRILVKNAHAQIRAGQK